MEMQKQVMLPVVLKGTNYLLWSRTTKTVLRSRGLWGHIEPQVETSKEGTEDKDIGGKNDPKWIQEDQQVLAILQSSLEASILAAYSYSETAKDLWDTLEKVYGNLSNISRIFEVKKALNDLQQGEKNFKDFFGSFRSLWAELEMLRPQTVDPKELNERREQDQVFGLLLTLNESFKGLIQHILRYEKLPTLEEVCMMIQKEEGSRELFNTPSEVAHFVRKPYGQERRYVECSYCKRPGHVKERCWILNPKLRPAKSKENGQGPRAFAGTTTVSSDELVRKSDLEALIKSITKLTESGKSLLALKPHKMIIVDSGASHHMIKDESLLKDVKPYYGKVTIANGKEVPIEGIGDLEIFERNMEALYVPKLTSNLLSVRKATKDLECSAIFSPNMVKFQDNKTREVIGEGKIKGDLYVLSNEGCISGQNFALGAVDTTSSWHARLGHPNPKTLQQVMPNLPQTEVECEACILGKQCRKPFSNSSTVYDEVFDLVHSDVWTAPCTSRNQYKYFVSFIDEKSKYAWVTLMNTKGQVYESFLNFHNYILTQFGKKVKVLRSDNGGEYMSGQLKRLLSNLGIIHQTTCPYTPQQNGVAERKNRHLLEMARTLMFDKGIPKSYWSDAVTTSCYLINRLPTRGLNQQSPYEVLNGTKPSIDHLRIFGCRCYVFVPEAQRSKLDPKSVKCVFVGYSPTQKGYKCLHPETNRLYITRDVQFEEDRSYFENKAWYDLKYEEKTSQEGLHNPNVVIMEIDDLSMLEETNSSTGQNNHTLDEENHMDEPNDSTESTEEGADSGGEEEENNPGDNEGVLGEIGDSQEEVLPTVPTLRRSQRQRFGPDHWKKTRVYYNNVAKVNVSPIVNEKCTERTADLDSVPIGDSISQSQEGSNTRKFTSLATTSVRYPIQNYCSLNHLPLEYRSYLANVDENDIPNSYEEACTKKEWVQAMNEEINSMERNKTWECTKLPTGKKSVGCRWVYTIKYKSTGEIERYKARLVAKGYTQVYGEDYTETFAPVAKLHSVRVLFSIAVNLTWELWQMDVKNAFLQGELEEEVYMAAPQGYATKTNDVCKLKKAIYGLKQSPRAWYQKLSGCLLERRFVKSEADHTLFTKEGDGGIIVVLIYVDDIILTGSNVIGIEETREALKTSFDIKDLGRLKYFLGIEVTRFNQDMLISQRKYVLDLLKETGKLGSKPARTPIEEGYQDQDEGEPWMDIKQYQRLVGKLIYLTITRPDICFAVNKVSQHMQAPKTSHWKMVERILRYLKGSPGKGIKMKNNSSTDIVGYCDADWAGDKTDRKSTTGYCTFVGGNLVTWRSKKQKVVSLSSAEAEYRAMKEVTKEIVWLKTFLSDLGIHQDDPCTLFCDNQAAIHIASNPVFHERTKHIEVDCHFVRGKIEEGVVYPMFIKSEDQVADIFTKATTSRVCDYIQSKIGLLDIHKPILRGSVETQRHEALAATLHSQQLLGEPLIEGESLQQPKTLIEGEGLLSSTKRRGQHDQESKCTCNSNYKEEHQLQGSSNYKE